MGLDRAIRMAYAPGERRDFTPPPEAPVFEPSVAEFADPLAYIARIRPRAEPYGICRIKPPARWRPPFSLDVDRLRFSPRVQKLNELHGLTRLRQHFEDRLCRFWEFRGHPIKSAPGHNGRVVDMFSLYHGVRIEGGFSKCEEEGKWPSLANFLGFDSTPGDVAPLFLRAVYRKLLLPFHEALCSPPRPKRRLERSSPTPSTPPRDPPSPDRPKKTKTGSDYSSSKKCTRELRRLACHGIAGPKMAICDSDDSDGDSFKLRKRIKFESDSEDRNCASCGSDGGHRELLLCERCSDVWHLSCATPPLEKTPLRWMCPPCLADETKRPMEAYGFAQADRTYSLQEFGEKADSFKSSHFEMPAQLVPTALVEKEFWRLLTAAEEHVTVLYGADLHSMDHGSGFPTPSSSDLHAGDQEYVDSGWNLNNLPVLEGSVLNFINDAISGMTVPWMYVGMCFSTFCWHNEDHWSYSINFLHWGEPKTWYGVPGDAAPLLEDRMKCIVPELFSSQPDLLHQLVTVVSPNVLSEAGVPVYRTDQAVGEFVVTFPRSYHAGFNQGYNFAEAVNFAPPDWLSVGRECVSHYKSIKRLCVFSHDELICKIGLSAKRLDVGVAISAYKELIRTVRLETEQRAALSRRGVGEASLRQFELMEDDQRLCEHCKTTCFLSALMCKKCRVMVCLDHVDELCECPSINYHLFYRYKLDELHLMIQSLKERVQTFDRWMTDAKSVLGSESPTRDRNEKLRKLVEESVTLNIPKCNILTKIKYENDKVTQPDSITIEIDE